MSGEVSEGLATPGCRSGLAAGVAMDEALLAMAMTPEPVPPKGRLRAGERRAGRRQADVLPPGVDRPARLLSPCPAPARPPRTSSTSRGWAIGLGYERITLRQRVRPRVRASPAESGGWPTSPTTGRRPPSFVTGANRAPGSCACTGSPWGTLHGLRRAAHRQAAPRARAERGPAGAAPARAAQGDPRERRALPVLRHDEHRPRV